MKMYFNNDGMDYAIIVQGEEVLFEIRANFAYAFGNLEDGLL